LINGTGAQLFDGTAAISTHFLANVTIDKSTDTLTMQNNISVTGDWTYIDGTVNPTSSTVLFRVGSETADDVLDLDGQGTGGTMAFNNITSDHVQLHRGI